jgi:Tfp pilus assembly protein FimT
MYKTLIFMFSSVVIYIWINLQSRVCFCNVSAQNKLDHLAALAARRKAKLMDNSAYLQFMCKADVVESWIADKETHVRSEEFGRDLSTVQTLLTKQETFDAGNKQFRVISLRLLVRGGNVITCDRTLTFIKDM